METDFIKGTFILDNEDFEYILNTAIFEIIVIPSSLHAFEKYFVGSRLDKVLIGSIDNSDRKIAFYGIYFYSSSLSKHRGKVDLIAVYRCDEKTPNENESKIYFRGKSADYLSVISRASNIDYSSDSIFAVPLHAFCFTLNISESVKIEIAYEKQIKTNCGSESNRMVFTGLETLIIKEQPVSIERLFEYYKYVSAANEIITNSVMPSFTDIEFEIVDSGQLLKGKILCPIKDMDIKSNYLVRDFNNYIEGVEKVFQESFTNEFVYTTFLRDDFGDCFSYERQFKLFSSFDYYYKKTYENATFSDPIAMAELKNDLLNLIDNNAAVLIGDNKKKKDYIKNLKRAIKNYDNSMCEIIKSLVFKNFIADEELATNYSMKMNTYRNCIVHGHVFQKIGEESINHDEMSYWDFVIYERLLLYIALIKHKDSFDLALFCKQLYAL